MAERLTEYFECGAYTTQKNIYNVSDRNEFFKNGCIMMNTVFKCISMNYIHQKKRHRQNYKNCEVGNE